MSSANRSERSRAVSAKLFGPGFESFDIEVDSPAGDHVRLHGTRGGSGPAVLLLHGYPQSHVMWHRVARELARDHTVVASDLRGYGASGRPESGPEHEGYSFRAMAADQVALMQALGFEEFAVVAHDRGARAAHRMVLDHPERVSRLALLDILPTAYVYANTDQRLATAYYHWFFYLQPELPERLIGSDPEFYLGTILGSFAGSEDVHHPLALAEYRVNMADPQTAHTMLEDYRAGASIDLQHDAKSEADGVQIEVPCLVLWGAAGFVGQNAEPPLEVWRTRAAEDSLVSGQAIADSAHFLVEENFDGTYGAISAFLAQGTARDPLG